MSPPVGTLFLIPVSLGDSAWSNYLPPDAKNLVGKLTHFIVENAKTSRAELKRLEHPLPLRQITIEQLPERIDIGWIDAQLAPLLAGTAIGLMSEAGCPGVADPGALLVRRAHELAIPVKPLVGPSSILLSLMASGLDGQRFAFHGYLPAREPERSKRIVELERESARQKQTQLFIETPYRNNVLFQALLTSCKPASRLCIASDLTTTTEFVITKTIAQWRQAALPDLDRRPSVFLLLA